jgi:hydroxypyruvate isomerase
VPAFNALYGNRVAGAAPEQQDELAIESLAIAAKAADRIGATVLVEPVSGPKPYPLRTADDVAAVLARARSAGAANVAMLFDMFHLANNGDDVATAVDRHADSIGHVQVADYPGRGEPGSGDLDLFGLLARLDRAGYDGWVALEYNPTTTTTESLAWLPRDRRGSRAGDGGSTNEMRRT